MRTVTEFNISVIVVTKMITYKFLRGVLLRMHDRSADGVFQSAILALLKTRVRVGLVRVNLHNP